MRHRPSHAVVAERNRRAWEQRVNRAIDHVGLHLADDLTLATLAGVAAFSPFHFHRVFAAVTGETLFGFIHRQRVEKAAGALLNGRDRSILEVALDHGFSSSATFARAFRAHFGMSATEWRAGGAGRWRDPQEQARNPGKQVRKQGKARRGRGGDTPGNLPEEAPMDVRVRTLPAYHVAYMRYVGPYGPHGIPELWTRLGTWIRAQGLGGPDCIKIGIGHDDPAITGQEKCRYDGCVVVPADFAGDKWVNVMDVPGGAYAVSPFTGSAHEIGEVWGRLYRSWLPGSGYEPDDRPCLEVYRGEPEVSDRPGTFRCELCVPVRPI
jgi:AraC family transcriptional regulator